ncbi:cation-transporting P-type ATPase [Lutimonas vermicola]|uniref:Cation-transporting P-type ATPase n=1 Tax=Lutimonas vermicola TaxID=414288 RepID=A0ABU9KW62_9FLAO
MIENAYSLSAEEIAKRFQTHLDNGLDKKTVKKHQAEYGLNQIPQDGPKSIWRILTDQLLDPIIYILTTASILAFLFSDWLEGATILIVIMVSVAIGFFMELQALRSLEALRKMGQTRTRVLRSGKMQTIIASELVPGDIILIQTGDVVTADARLVSQESLSIKESALTGESIPISKNTENLPLDTPITDQRNMLFKGTITITGSGKAIVTATGANTELGKIQQMGMEAQKEITPLEKKLNQLTKWLIWLTLVFAVLIIVAGYIRGKDLLLMIETGVALAVAAIPEGLPIVATIALAKGMMRLSKRQVIIKKLEAIQTLGATNIICTDKTGTLTEDKMKVHAIYLADTELYDIQQKNKDDFDVLKGQEAFYKIALASILCNNVSSFDEGIQGDSIEVALLDFAIKAGCDINLIRENNPKKLEMPFDADRKLMATVHQNKQGFYAYVKGAFETLVAECDSILEDGKIIRFTNKEKWYEKVDTLASQGLRTLAFGYKEVGKIPEDEDLTKQLVFLGIMGFMDPAREDVKATIDIYRKAGIKVIMVTGDHLKTAQKIAEEVGLLTQDASSDLVLHGQELLNIVDMDTKTKAHLLNASVFARVTPKQKLDLITFHQKQGNIVGMIGDGINDVPALKKADIGIAMGIRGTEAAREVADVILKNDKFTAIELAIRQGRVVFQNIRQFVVYLLSCNLAEIVSVGIAALLNLPAPLLPLQILFLNLVTDVFPALALGLGKGEGDIMEQAPRDPKEPIMTRSDWYLTMFYGLSISISVLGIVTYAYYIMKLNWEVINNMAFYTLVLAQLFNVFNIPHHRESVFNNEVTKNIWIWGAILLSLFITWGAYITEPIAQALSLLPLTTGQFLITILFALGSFALAQLIKQVRGAFGLT